jgi:hypothetical protein
MVEWDVCVWTRTERHHAKGMRRGEKGRDEGRDGKPRWTHRCTRDTSPPSCTPIEERCACIHPLDRPGE